MPELNQSIKILHKSLILLGAYLGLVISIKSQYKDVVQNGIYEYFIQAIGNNGKVLNEQGFKVKKYCKEERMSKVFYYGQKNLKEELKDREVYDIAGKLIKDVSRLPYGIYLIK